MSACIHNTLKSFKNSMNDNNYAKYSRNVSNVSLLGMVTGHTKKVTQQA